MENRERMGKETKEQGELWKIVGRSTPAPPVKGISRGQHKSTKDYTKNPSPREGYILDYLRSAIVVEDVDEMICLFHHIMQSLTGSIIRIKNGFNPLAECSYGYRAVMVNFIYPPGETQSVNGRKMVCEIQIILKDYLIVRKKMHMYYKIARAHEQWAIGRDFSKMWDL